MPGGWVVKIRVIDLLLHDVLIIFQEQGRFWVRPIGPLRSVSRIQIGWLDRSGCKLLFPSKNEDFLSWSILVQMSIRKQIHVQVIESTIFPYWKIAIGAGDGVLECSTFPYMSTCTERQPQHQYPGTTSPMLIYNVFNMLREQKRFLSSGCCWVQMPPVDQRRTSRLAVFTGYLLHTILGVCWKHLLDQLIVCEPKE